MSLVPTQEIRRRRAVKKRVKLGPHVDSMVMMGQESDPIAVLRTERRRKPLTPEQLLNLERGRAIRARNIAMANDGLRNAAVKKRVRKVKAK